jgi:hypothetical protein
MTIPDGEAEANNIENRAAKKSYDCGFGVSEWEAFLEPEETNRLIELGEQGFGTWGREPETIERMKRIKSA